MNHRHCPFKANRLFAAVLKPLLVSIFTVVPLMVVSCSNLPDPRKESGEISTLVKLRDEIDRWMGTPYRFGGTSRKGIDCSAFAMTIYRDAFGLKLPRTTDQLIKLGDRIDIGYLKAGDLVFFFPESKKMHMGIYLSHGDFAHASVSKGVMISSMNSPYWKRRFLTARRLKGL